MANKADLIDKITENTDFTKKSTQKFLDACLEAIEEDLQNGGNLKLTSFGSFKVQQRKERSVMQFLQSFPPGGLCSKLT